MSTPGDQERPSVEALIFDLFGVMISFDNDIVYRRLAEHCADPHEAFRSLDGQMSGLNVITGRQSLAQTYDILRGTLGLKLSFEAFLVAWNTPYSASMPGMADLVERLAPHHKLVLLSNVDIDYWQVVRPLHPELDRFDALIISAEVGLAKPDPRIFEHACEVAGMEPARCLFIDDTPNNVRGALKAGLQGHVFRSVPALEAELRQRGVAGL